MHRYAISIFGMTITTKQLDNHHAIMDAANKRGLTIAGIPVRVGGARLDFAQVAVSDRKHPMFGWSSEYSWAAIERVTNGSGKLG